MCAKSSKTKATSARAVAPKKRGADKFLVEDGIKFPLPEVHSESEVTNVGCDPETALVSDVMLRQTLYCYADQSALEVRDIIRLHGVKQLPVVDTNMRIIGIVYRDAIEKITEPKKK